ncbi:hypothetical protein DL764_006622 [Monosporascus ibericus]|uniref:Uncharacterized protein n=1 Tax=Monosporascus ibericus TaxID=155417 RepID=A0A4Q4T7D8_9PEZI|nr:hypothetical protein DL764_006622 [Monosporascus ibericus]
MATSPSVAENPPPYITADQNEADEVVQPVILVLTGLCICAETSGMTRLYELSQDIRQPSHGESKVSLSRVAWNVRTNADGTPRLTQRNRHIFDLKHLPSLLLKGFPYSLDPVSRSAAGKLGLKTLPFPRSGFKMVRLEPENGEGLPKGYKAMRRSDREAGTVFEIRKKRGHYEWIGPDGCRLAVEDDVADERKLIITAPTSRATADAMVASWSLRIWHNSIESNPENSTTCEPSSLTAAASLQIPTALLVPTSGVIHDVEFAQTSTDDTSGQPTAEEAAALPCYENVFARGEAMNPRPSQAGSTEPQLRHPMIQMGSHIQRRSCQ